MDGIQLSQSGRYLQKQGKLDDAIDRFQQAIAVAPNQTWVHISQAMIHLTQSKPDDAITEYQKAIKGQPNNAGIYYGLTRAYSLKNEKEVSIQWLQKAVKLNKILLNGLRQTVIWIISDNFQHSKN